MKVLKTYNKLYVKRLSKKLILVILGWKMQFLFMLTYVSAIENSHFAFTSDSFIYHATTGRHNMIRCGLFLQNEIKEAWSCSCELRRWGGLWFIMESTVEKRSCFTCRCCFAGEENDAGHCRRVYPSPLCQNTDEIESEVSTETAVIAKCHVCIIIQNQLLRWDMHPSESTNTSN